MKLIKLSPVENQNYFRIVVETVGFWRRKKIHTEYLIHLNTYYTTGLVFSHNLDKVPDDLARQIKLAMIDCGIALK